MSTSDPSTDDGFRVAPPLEPPTRQDLRDEVAADPHSAPPALMRFARQMAERMEEAKGSEARSRRLFDRLADCARDPGRTAALQVRATCLANAGRLAREHPSFSDDYRDLVDQAAEIQRFLRVTGLDDGPDAER